MQGHGAPQWENHFCGECAHNHHQLAGKAATPLCVKRAYASGQDLRLWKSCIELTRVKAHEVCLEYIVRDVHVLWIAMCIDIYYLPIQSDCGRQSIQLIVRRSQIDFSDTPVLWCRDCLQALPSMREHTDTILQPSLSLRSYSSSSLAVFYCRGSGRQIQVYACIGLSVKHLPGPLQAFGSRLHARLLICCPTACPQPPIAHAWPPHSKICQC